MEMIDRDIAHNLARKSVKFFGTEAGFEFEIQADATIEINAGWVFFYNSSEYLRTGNPSAKLAGNGPILVTREGKIHVLPTSEPWEEAIGKIK